MIVSTGRTMEQQADLAVALLDALHMGPVALYGASAGGPPTLQIALRHPQRVWAMILEGAISRRYRRASPLVLRLLINLVYNDPVMWLQYVYARSFPRRVTKARLRKLGRLTRAQINDVLPRIMSDPRKARFCPALFETCYPASSRRPGVRNDFAQFAAIDRWPLERIPCPTLVLHGKLDAAVDISHAEFCARTIPNVQTLFVEDGTHLLRLCDPVDAIRDRVIAFLKQHAGGDHTAVGILGA